MGGEYEVNFEQSKPRYVGDFLSSLGAQNTQWRPELAQIPRNTFLNEVLGTSRLSTGRAAPTSALTFAIDQWWEEHFFRPAVPRLDFVMINRLAELVIRSNPQIASALQMTYQFVFVDEFQDTSYAQYDFLGAVFGSSGTSMRAVGDNKQRIMVFAGAMANAFERFEDDHSARRFELTMNHRSSPALVAIQHVVAKAIDQAAADVSSAIESTIDGEAAAIWQFDSKADEARQLAKWIAEDIVAEGLELGSYAIVVKQTAEEIADSLSPEFSANGLKLRNDSQRIGKMLLQDLMVDELNLACIGVLKVALNIASPAQYLDVRETVRAVRGVDPADETSCRRADQELSEMTDEVAAWMDEHPSTGSSAAALLARVHSFIDLASASRTFPRYRHGRDIALSVESQQIRFQEIADGVGDWAEFVNVYEGADAISLMTVHKSKGLEYHTIIFLGIDDKQWWSHSPGDMEGRSTFFVGLSRAEQRVFFTHCKGRGGRRKVSDLFDLLATAGVPTGSPTLNLSAAPN